jgi:hypothetical protein
MTKQKMGTWLRDLHIRTVREEGATAPKLDEPTASKETMENLERDVTVAIENYLVGLYGMNMVEGKGKLNVKFDFESEL